MCSWYRAKSFLKNFGGWGGGDGVNLEGVLV